MTIPVLETPLFPGPQREDWQNLQHPITQGSLFDHTRHSSSGLTGIEVLVKKFGIQKNPAYKKEISLANTREAAEPLRKASRTQRWDTWVRDLQGGKGDMRS